MAGRNVHVDDRKGFLGATPSEPKQGTNSSDGRGKPSPYKAQANARRTSILPLHLQTFALSFSTT